MFNIFNNLSTLYNSYKKKPQNPGLPGISTPQPTGTYPYTPPASKNTLPGINTPQPTGTYPYKPPVQKTTPPPQPAPVSASDEFQRKYQEYLNQSKSRKEQLVQANSEEEKRKAMEQANANQNALTSSQSNIDAMMKGFRERTAAGSARLETQAEQNRQRAATTSGENQRQLAETRRQQLGDIERKYSALGTIDSYGTGSFQSANSNEESNFLRLTAQNKQSLQNDLQDIDNKLFDAKAAAEDKIAVEEGKYNDAILEINRQLAGNEIAKQQAIRAADQMFAQKKSDITDEYESYRLSAEKEKADKVTQLQEASAADEQLKQIFTGASPEFLTTGQPKTAQDQFIIFKYPKEVETYMKMLTDSRTLSGGGTEKLKLVSLIDDIMGSNDLERITGMQALVPLLPGAKEQMTKGQIDQLKALLSLENRQKLKGQGAISDKEMAILERASSLLNQSLSADQTRQVLKQLKTELSTGQPVSINAQAGNRVTVVSPTGEEGTIDASDLQEAIKNGYKQI